MGRANRGWKIRQRAPGHAFAVRFWINGREIERSTGTSDAVEAAREAARIYASEVQREPRRKLRRLSEFELEELVAAWLVAISATHDPGTCATWELYATTHWMPHFGALHHVNEAMCAEYMRSRLRKVLATTVRKELSSLRSFLEWAKQGGYLPAIEVSGPPRRATGTPYEKRRRSAAIEISPEECWALIDALPEWSSSRKVDRFPIRARFVVGYETGLRPSALDGLTAPEHYRRGSSTITLTAELDKSRWGRELPLSKAARDALDAICPAEGLIFGAHDYRPRLRAAALSALPRERAQKFCGAHLRSAMVTHALEETGNLPGVQHMAGHKMTSTTALYVRPSLRAALEVVRARSPRKRKRRRAR